jgi:hypothetical protein
VERWHAIRLPLSIMIKYGELYKNNPWRNIQKCILLGEWYIIVQMIKEFEDACPKGVGSSGS